MLSSAVSIRRSEEGAHVSEADRATEDSLKSSDVEGEGRICAANGIEWDLQIVLNIIADDNNSSASHDDV